MSTILDCKAKVDGNNENRHIGNLYLQPKNPFRVDDNEQDRSWVPIDESEIIKKSKTLTLGTNLIRLVVNAIWVLLKEIKD